MKKHKEQARKFLKYPIILASGSPRRKQFLEEMGLDFQIVVPDIAEDALTVEDPIRTAQSLARDKALAVFDLHDDSLIIAGDTVVALPVGESWVQLSKPLDAADAARMLRALSGKRHLVVSGLCLRWPKGMISAAEKSWVSFKNLTDEAIAAYVATGQSMDKAGAYGLQDESHSFIEKVEGSITNVIGLPMELLEESLKSVD